jgi:tRNA (guanine-N7-)-methyltransferase
MGRPLKKDRLEALEKILPQIAVPENKLTGDATLDPRTLFPTTYKETWFEIGFGNGEHLAALKEKFTDVNFLGAEPFVNGMANLLKEITDEPLDNIRVLMDDALLLVHSLTDHSLDRIYVLNPDPWPKTRHHKRRIISQKNLTEFARVLKPGGRLVMATDVDDLAQWMEMQCVEHPAFDWEAKNPDRQNPPPEWTETRYAFKGKQAGRKQTFLVFKTLAKA